jgi:hypothetical protein
MSLNMTLNATELEQLKECENISKAEPVEAEEIPLENLSFDTMLDNARYVGYCMGLNMKQGFNDAVGNYSNFIK